MVNPAVISLFESFIATSLQSHLIKKQNDQPKIRTGRACNPRCTSQCYLLDYNKYPWSNRLPDCYRGCPSGCGQSTPRLLHGSL